MSWRELITEVYNGRRPQPGIAARPEFYPGATAQAIAGAESDLNATLPDSLRSLLLETNGVMDMLAIDGGDWFESIWLLWKIEETVEQNRCYRGALAARNCKCNVKDLVFFASAGTDGILFGFPVEVGVCAPRVMVWQPIADTLEELALTLEVFLRGWLTSEITV